MNTNLNLYKVFYTVAKNKSITRAAEELMISQPAVSKDIKTLEEQLGITLFKRENNKLELTESASLIYKNIEYALNEISVAESNVKQYLNMEIGTLRIGLSDVILDEYLMPYIVKFREMYPNINLIIYTSNEDIYKKYNLGLIDIFFNNMPTDLPNQGVFEEVKTLTNCFVASEKFSDYKNKKLDYKALEELPLLVLNKGSINRNRLDDFCYKHKIKLNCKMEFSSNNLVKKFTLNGFGIGMLDEEYVKEELKNKKLFKLDIDVPLDRKFLIMFYNEHNQNLALKKFIDLIREEQ